MPTIEDAIRYLQNEREKQMQMEREKASLLYRTLGEKKRAEKLDEISKRIEQKRKEREIREENKRQIALYEKREREKRILEASKIFKPKKENVRIHKDCEKFVCACCGDEFYKNRMIRVISDYKNYTITKQHYEKLKEKYRFTLWSIR